MTVRDMSLTEMSPKKIRLLRDFGPYSKGEVGDLYKRDDELAWVYFDGDDKRILFHDEYEDVK
jgi:hypothetical protein